MRKFLILPESVFEGRCKRSLWLSALPETCWFGRISYYNAGVFADKAGSCGDLPVNVTSAKTKPDSPAP